MKKLVLVVAIIIASFEWSTAQEVGIRFGGTNGAGGAAIDGIFGTGVGRIHADLGFYDIGLGIDVLWDFLYEPLGDESFNWYLGAGPTTLLGNEFWLGATGEVGLEYRFNTVPLAIGMDWRPTLWIVNETRFGIDSFGLNVRWVIGE